MGLQSSAYNVDFTLASTTPTANAIFVTDGIPITKSILGGDSGQIRVWVALNAVSEPTLEFTKSFVAPATFTGPMKLNPDQSFFIGIDGLYRFDIGVDVGDILNFRSTLDCTITNFVIHTVPMNA